MLLNAKMEKAYVVCTYSPKKARNCGKSNNAPQVCPGANPGTLPCKRDFPDVIKLRTSRWGIVLNYSGKPNVISKVKTYGREVKEM